MTTYDHFLKPDGAYLLSHSVGILPRSADAAAHAAFFDPWRANPDDVWARWFDAVEDFRKALAMLFQFEPQWFCPQPNVSSGLSKIIHALPFDPRRPAVLLAEASFPSLGFVLDRARRAGFRPKFISPRTAFDPDAWIDAMTPEVGLVLLTHVQSEDGCQQPVADVVRAAALRDIVSIVDVAQSAGVIPISLAEWQADFVIGSSVKWLCGGPGAGFLWVRPERLTDCVPLDTGWFSHMSPFDLDIHSFQPAEDARRFWGGTPSVLPYVVAASGIRTICAIGVSNVRAHNLQLCARLLEGLETVEVIGTTNLAERGGTLVLRTDGSPAELVSRLKALRVHVDARQRGIRVSPHIYTSKDEVDLTIEALRRTLTT